MMPVREIAPLTYQGVGVGTGQQLVPARSGRVNVYNGDISNVLLLSPDKNPQFSNSVPVQPLTNASIDASERAYYGSCLTAGKVCSQVTVSAFTLTPSPAQIATQIALSGVGLLKAKTNLGTATNVNVPAGGSVNLINSMPVSQLGYQLIISPVSTGVPTTPFFNAHFLWLDSSGNTEVFDEFVFGPIPSSGGSANALGIEGPNRGDQLLLVFNNLSNLAANILVWSFTETSDIMPNQRALEWNIGGPINGFTRPGNAPGVGLIATTTPTIAASSTTSRLVPVWGGDATITVDNSGSANALTVTLTDPNSLYSGTPEFAAFLVASGGIQLTTDITLPYGPTLLNMKNGGAGTITPTVTIMRRENG